MKTIQYLDAAKKKLGISSDYALAKQLDITRASMSLLVNGKTFGMSNTTAAKIAEILELDPLKVIADAELERGSNDELWKRIAKKVAFVGSAAIGAALLYNLQSTGADSELAGAVIAAVQTGPLCIMSTQAGPLILAAIAVFAVFPELLRAPGSALAHWRDRLLGTPTLRLV